MLNDDTHIVKDRLSMAVHGVIGGPFGGALGLGCYPVLDDAWIWGVVTSALIFGIVGACFGDRFWTWFLSWFKGGFG